MVYARGEDGRLDLRGTVLPTDTAEATQLTRLQLSVLLTTLYESLNFEPETA